MIPSFLSLPRNIKRGDFDSLSEEQRISLTARLTKQPSYVELASAAIIVALAVSLLLSMLHAVDKGHSLNVSLSCGLSSSVALVMFAEQRARHRALTAISARFASV